MLFRSSEIEDGGAFPHDKYDHSALFSDEIQDGDACDDEDDLEQASLLSRNSETTTTNSSSSSLSSSPAVEAAAVLSSSFSSLCSSVSSSFCFRADGVQNTGKGMVWRMCGEGGSGPVMALLSLVLLCAMAAVSLALFAVGSSSWECDVPLHGFCLMFALALAADTAVLACILLLPLSQEGINKLAFVSYAPICFECVWLILGLVWSLQTDGMHCSTFHLDSLRQGIVFLIMIQSVRGYWQFSDGFAKERRKTKSKFEDL